jgi:hypothetical protein
MQRNQIFPVPSQSGQDRLSKVDAPKVKHANIPIKIESSPGITMPVPAQREHFSVILEDDRLLKNSFLESHLEQK